MPRWLEWIYRQIEGESYTPPPPERGSRTQQAHPVPPARSAHAPHVHYHEWDPGEACVTDHRTLVERRAQCIALCGHARRDHHERTGGMWCSSCMSEAHADGDDPMSVGPCW